MLFGRRNQLIGLDIGTSSIKFAEVNDSPKGPILKKFVKEKVPSDLFKDGDPQDPNYLSAIIKDIFQKNKIKNKNVAMSIGGYSAIVKLINIPVSEDEQEIQRNVMEQAEHYIPFDISEVNTDYQVMGESEQTHNQLSVLLVAAKNDIINKYALIAQNAGLNPFVMDIDAFAVQNIFEYNEPDVENAVLINVGASKISLNIVDRRKSVFMREVAMGASQITNEIMSLDPSLTFDDAEEIKLSFSGNEKVSTQDLEQIMSSVASEWCTEISRALDFYYSNNPGGRIEKVYVCGGGSRVENFKEELASVIDAEIKPLNSLQVIHTEKSGYSEEELEAISPEVSVALGLGLRRMDDK
ncbi:MAG: type IV pilus assembly protein PilM [Thermodesulfobacteriota bacterium]